MKNLVLILFLIFVLISNAEAARAIKRKAKAHRKGPRHLVIETRGSKRGSHGSKHRGRRGSGRRSRVSSMRF